MTIDNHQNRLRDQLAQAHTGGYFMLWIDDKDAAAVPAVAALRPSEHDDRKARSYVGASELYGALLEAAGIPSSQETDLKAGGMPAHGRRRNLPAP